MPCQGRSSARRAGGRHRVVGAVESSTSIGRVDRDRRGPLELVHSGPTNDRRPCSCARAAELTVLVFGASRPPGANCTSNGPAPVVPSLAITAVYRSCSGSPLIGVTVIERTQQVGSQLGLAARWAAPLTAVPSTLPAGADPAERDAEPVGRGRRQLGDRTGCRSIRRRAAGRAVGSARRDPRAEVAGADGRVAPPAAPSTAVEPDLAGAAVPVSGRITAVTDDRAAGRGRARGGSTNPRQRAPRGRPPMRRSRTALPARCRRRPLSSAPERARDRRHLLQDGLHHVPFKRALSRQKLPPAPARSGYVIWYSGPSPPSGGVRRPPLAVIAPHCTQLV